MKEQFQFSNSIAMHTEHKNYKRLSRLTHTQVTKDAPKNNHHQMETEREKKIARF